MSILTRIDRLLNDPVLQNTTFLIPLASPSSMDIDRRISGGDTADRMYSSLHSVVADRFIREHLSKNGIVLDSGDSINSSQLIASQTLRTPSQQPCLLPKSSAKLIDDNSSSHLDSATVCFCLRDVLIFPLTAMNYTH